MQRRDDDIPEEVRKFALPREREEHFLRQIEAARGRPPAALDPALERTAAPLPRARLDMSREQKQETLPRRLRGKFNAVKQAVFGGDAEEFSVETQADVKIMPTLKFKMSFAMA